MCHFDNLLILVEKSLELLDADFLSEYLTDLLTAVVTHRVGRTYKFFCNECEKGETDHAYENGTPASNFSYCCHVGDSRLYTYREGNLVQVTRDHTYVADLQANGEITEEEAFIHPQRHILMKALGVEESVRSDSLHFKLVPNDRLLLCSDGLSDMLRDQEILDIMGGADLEKVADELLERSLSNGGRDNVSFIIIDMAEKAVAREAGLHG